MGKYLSVIGIFLVGVVIVIIGLYYFLTSVAESFEYQLGIAIMLIGLLVTGVGAISGKRKMRSVHYFAKYPPESSRAPAQPRSKPAPPAAPASSAPSAGPAPASQAPSRPTPTAPATQPKPSQEKPAKTGEKVVKILVCPKCGSENQVSDTFCFNCGKKLRPKTMKK